MLNMSWRDTVTWEELLTHTGTTSRMVPEKLHPAIFDLQNTMAAHIESLDGVSLILSIILNGSSHTGLNGLHLLDHGLQSGWVKGR